MVHRDHRSTVEQKSPHTEVVGRSSTLERHIPPTHRIPTSAEPAVMDRSTIIQDPDTPPPAVWSISMTILGLWTLIPSHVYRFDDLGDPPATHFHPPTAHSTHPDSAPRTDAGESVRVTWLCSIADSDRGGTVTIENGTIITISSQTTVFQGSNLG